MEPILINTKGHCFLCLDEGNSFETQSLQSLCRYSKIDVGNILTSFTFGIEFSSNVKVSLCMKCNKVVSQISCKYLLLESLQMELDNLVLAVHKSIEGADAQVKSIQKEKFLSNMNEDLGCRLQLKLVEELRMTLFNKCTKRGSGFQPRVDAMNVKPIIKGDRVPDLIDDDEGHTDSETLLTTEIGESISSDRSLSETNDGSFQSEMATSLKKKSTTGEKTFQSRKTSLKRKRGRFPGHISAKLRENSFLNPENGKIQCAKCPKEFKAGRNGFRWHFESKHLGIRHNCNFCKKSFSQRYALYKHTKFCRQKPRMSIVQSKLAASETSSHLPCNEQPIDDLDSENISEGETPLRKKRGRPPGHKTFQSGEISFMKKRGRPPGHGAFQSKELTLKRKWERFSGHMLKENSSFDPKTGMIQCAKCPKKFKYMGSAFRWHFESQHLGIRYNCRYCKKSFSLKGPLGRHRKVCHQKARMRKAQPDTTESETPTSSPDVSQIDNLDSESIPEKVSESGNSENTDFFKSIIFNKCKDCSGIFYNLDSLREHRKTVHSSNGDKTPIFAKVHSYNSS